MGIIRGIGPRCRKQVTGQIVQYDSMDDDGQLQEGYARKYVALSTGDYAGTTDIIVNGKTIAMENACVIDQNSGLMWLKNTPDSDIGVGNDGQLYWIDAVNNEDIFTFCDAANTQTLAGHSDWRVPNVFELFSLVVEDAGIGAPYIDTTYFQCISAYYWPSTTYPTGAAGALLVAFDLGRVYGGTKTTGLYYVRLVRGG
ncbi:hypothetical protein LCGC14_0611380 [marine sediment metagenome]|uniref:Lcl C-terminal domain-containing protein n=1 Tax=marine sediment metagenome TaxID=412755 RepID=A0A0F9TTX0_9ZZZZ